MALSAQEQAELAQLEKEVGHLAKPVASSGLSPQEHAEMAQLEKEVGHLQPQAAQSAPLIPEKYTSEPMISKDNRPFVERMSALPGKIADSVSKIPETIYDSAATLGKTALRAANIPGGLMRAGLYNSAGLVSGQGSIVKPQDITAAVVGKGPDSEEYMKRLGVPEMDTGIVSGRGALGFASDIATDPTNALIKGAKGLGLIEKEIRPVGELAESLGKSTYKSGFKKIDERLIEKNKTPLSDILIKEGAPVGTTKQIADKTNQLAKDISTKRGSAYKKMDELGGHIDMSQASFPKAEARILKLSQSRLSKDRQLAEDLRGLLSEYKSSSASAEELSSLKSGLYDALPDSAFSGGKIHGEAKRFSKELASDFKDTIVNHGNAAEDGLGSHVDDLNDTWSSLITSEQPMKMQIRRGESQNLATSVDAMLAGTGLGAAIPLKKAADFSKTTLARTAAGKGLMSLGKTQIPDAVVRRGLINSGKD